MHLALISDIHSNYEALRAVLDDIQRRQIPLIACLGDIIGYGPQPCEVIGALQHIRAVKGNHDIATCSSPVGFSEHAEHAIRRTQALLNPLELDYLQKLPTSISMGDVYLVHALPPDDTQTIIYDLPQDLIYSASLLVPPRIICVGHTHVAAIFCNGEETRPELEVPVNLDARKSYIINPGSVGLPRDGCVAARYAEITERTATFHAVTYDASPVLELITARCFPQKVRDILSMQNPK